MKRVVNTATIVVFIVADIRKYGILLRMVRLKLTVGIVVALFLLACRIGSNASQLPSDSSSESLSASVVTCGVGATFSALPLLLTDLGDGKIVPLGNLNPPDHTFPTNHIYFYLKTTGSNNTTVNVPVYAPGDITITSISSSTNLTANRTDYSITFYLCSQLQGYFYHVASLSSALTEAFNNGSGSCTTYNPGSGDYTRCNKSVSVTAKAGDQIGTAGGATTSSLALDFGLYDSRITALTYANDARTMSNNAQFDDFHVVCPIDYFNSTVKAQLEAQLNRAAGATPLCGSVDQDQAGTAQGKWFEPSAASPPTSESGNLALAHSNTDPTIPVFSIGNSTLGTGAFTFVAVDSGAVNRDFSGVTADGQLYCYQALSMPGIIYLLQMTDSKSLKIERQSAAICPAAPAFTNAAMSFVR